MSGGFATGLVNAPAMAGKWLRARAVTIRGKILLAFCAMAALTGLLGIYAVNSVVESGRLVVETYDKPLMSTSYARLALSNFTAMELEWAHWQATEDAERRHQFETRIDELGRALDEDLTVAEKRSMTQRAAMAAAKVEHAVAEWNALRRRILTDVAEPADMSALDQAAAVVVDAFDSLVEFTAEDGFKGRETALASITTYYRLSIAATLAALLLGAGVAVTLSQRMVRPIAAASRAAGRIAEGELGVEIVSAGGDELGQLLQSMATMRDNIRGMMEREIAARRSAQAQLVNALESSAEGVVLVDGEGHILTANSQVSAFFPDLAGAFVEGAPLPAALETVLGETTAEVQLADGRWLRLSRSGTENGGFVVIASDITVLKERETALQFAKEQAEAANRAKTEFLANMSHELRTPLNAVIGFSEIIAGEMFGPVGQAKYKDFAADILRSGHHLLEVISDILDIAKLQSGKAELHLQPIHVEELIEDAMRIVRKQAEVAGLTLDRSVAPDLPAVEADPTRVRQLLLNLLSNAIKFTPTGGKVSVTAGRGREGVFLAVTDTGIGMEAKDIPKALEPFSQVDSSLSRKYGGTGLGLPLSKLFAEMHGGRLLVESTPGRGTTVTVVLPATMLPSRPWAVAS